MSGGELSDEHREALDGCYDRPLAVAEVGDDAAWWALLFDLRSWGFVTFDDDSTEIPITEAGRVALDSDDDDEDEEAPETPGAEYDGDYISTLDGLYPGPVAASEYAEYWDWIETFVRNGHVSNPGDGWLYLTDAGRALL